MKRAIAISVLSFTLPLYALAHTSGIFYDAHDGNVHLDIGYSSAAPQVGEAVLFDFNLAADQPASTKYTDAWVRIDSEDGNVVLATAVHNAAFGGPRMSYVFPHAGKYTVSVRYENESDAIAKGSFPITVIPAASAGVFGFVATLPAYALLLIGLIIGALMCALILKFGSLKKILARPRAKS